MLSRKTIVELVKALRFRTHNEIDQFALLFDLDAVVSGEYMRKMLAAPIARTVLLKPGSDWELCCNRDGTTTVIEASEDYSRVAVNDRAEPTFASFAPVSEGMFVRTALQLLRINYPLTATTDLSGQLTMRGKDK